MEIMGSQERKKAGRKRQAVGKHGVPSPHLLFHMSPGGHGCMPIVKQRPRRLFGTGICQAGKTLLRNTIKVLSLE